MKKFWRCYLVLFKRGRITEDEFCNVIYQDVVSYFIIGALFGVFLMILFSLILRVLQYAN